MIDRAIIVTTSSALYEEIQNELLTPTVGAPLCRTVLPRHSTTQSALELINRAPSSIALMVIDATTPSSTSGADGEQGEPTLGFLRELRSRGEAIRVIALLPHRMEAIEVHCAKNESDYALYTENFSGATLRTALRRVNLDPGQGARTLASDVTIEITIGEHMSKVETIDEAWRSRQTREVLVPYISTLKFYADEFRTWRMFETVEQSDGRRVTRAVPGWRDRLKFAGQPLYELVRSVLGEGLLQEYIQRPEGLNRVHFRFHIPDSLFTVPFEALYDSQNHSFIRIRAPLARRFVMGSGIQPSNDKPCTSSREGLRILFVRADVDGVVQLFDPDGGIAAQQQWFDFESLANLALEEQMFRQHIDGRPWHGGKIEVEFFSGGNGTRFVDGLREKLTQKFDFVHFAGHSLTTDRDQTFLILPGSGPSAPCGLPVSAFAQWAGNAGVRFVYLSSCRGGSCRAVQILVANGIPHVFGFRWDVEDDMAARFAEIFYGKLLRSDRSIAKAYRDACEDLHNDPERGSSPIWASPVLIMQSDDWWRRSA